MRIIIFVIIAILFSTTGCQKSVNKPSDDEDFSDIDFRQEMRNFVMEIAEYSRNYDNDFIVIPQNGQELITDSGNADGITQTEYLQTIDATGREDLFYGYTADDQSTPQTENEYMLGLCHLCEENGVEVLTIDYCSTHSKMDDSYTQNNGHGFISFAADDRNLRNIPDYPVVPFNQNDSNITEISQAKNFLYLINSEFFLTKQDFINAVSQTNYDALIMDLFHFGDAFTLDEVNLLKIKQNGGRRLVICYMSIGEAEDYRYYWQENWFTNKPDWLETENPDWPGNYEVQYWHPEWKAIMTGNENSYLQNIINAGFDGVYLDLIDAFEYFEQNY